MKKKILYIGIPFFFISIGFYYLNYTNTGNYKKNFHDNLELLSFDKKQFEIPQLQILKNNIQNQENAINRINNNKFDNQLNQEIIALFSPRDDIRGAIIDYISKESDGIICAAFRLTDQDITKSFLIAHEKGIKLTFIIDKEGLSSMHSKVLHLFNLGIPVFIFPPIGRIEDAMIQGLMHNKILLFLNQKIVITGSYNYTKSAQNRNRENILIIKNNDVIFDKYLNELKFLMSESSKFQSQYFNSKFDNKTIKNKRIKNKKNKKINFSNNFGAGKRI